MQHIAAAMFAGLVAALSLAGCSKQGEDHAAQVRDGLPQQPPAPPPPPGPNFIGGDTIALPGQADASGLSDAEIDAMFDAAVARMPLDRNEKAICAGMQGLSDRAVADAPARVVRRLAEKLRLPAVPASQCKFDVVPHVIATKAEAMIYTVKVESRSWLGTSIFWATATAGNMGSDGAKFRLVREGGRWVPKFLGVTIQS